MSLINTAITGIRLSQAALAVTGHNIVNANTEGYSRQSITQATTTSVRTPAGYLGTGVQLVDIYRNTEKFLVDQVAMDIATLSDFDTYLFNVSQTNNLLASDQTNLSRYMNQFFDALSESINDPGSLLGRQLLMTQTQQMVAGFKAIESRLIAQNTAVNKQLEAAAANITSLGQQISNLNRVIADSNSGGGSGQSPNDLLDKRETLIRELSRYTNVTTINREDGGIDVFIGQSQPLVVGSETNILKAAPGTSDASRFDLYFVKGNEMQNITRQLTGGEIGGLVRFRNEALEPAMNAVGLLAMAIVDGVNKQNKLGMTLEGSLGGSIFADINDPVFASNRVKASSNNQLPNDKIMGVTIDSVSNLTGSDYELIFPGPGGQQYQLIRRTDGQVVEKGILGATMPQEISVDGFTLTIKAGTFNAGDRFTIQPTKASAGQMNMKITRPQDFAFASPLRIETASGNQGGAQVLGSQVLSTDTDLFTQAGKLNPPLMIRFTSATTYDVLDYSDPARPVPLNPPLMNQAFVPGGQNSLFPSDPDGTFVTSAGPAALVLRGGETSNGYPGEVVTVQTTDPVTGFISEQSITLTANEQASDIARRMSSLDGVTATAYSYARLNDFQADDPDEPMQLSLNGVNLTDPDLVLDGQSSPRPVPVPLTADYLRDSINNNPALKAQGIYALSDGVNLSVHSTTGVDLSFNVGGTGSLQAFTSADNGAVATTINAPDPGDPDYPFTIGGKVDIQLVANAVVVSDQTAGIFGALPQAQSNFLGIQVSMTSGAGADGQPRPGDSFVLAYNTNGSADNRNGAAMLALSSAATLGNGTLNYQESYGQLAEKIGILTSQARVNQSASESMLRQSMNALQSVVGVNLEEEAARLIQLEQHYNASARLIGLARELFDTLLNM